MKAEFTNSFGNSTTTISIQKVVRANAPTVRSICINCGYELKDKAKEWAKKHGGTWHPVLKVWYVPADVKESKAIEIIQDLEKYGLIKKYCYVFLDNRADEKYNESIKKFFGKVFPEDQAPPMGTVYDVHDVYPEDKEYISDPLYYIKEVGEVEQPQGYIDFKKEKHFRVLISYTEKITPEDEMYLSFGAYWREFKLENGDKVWCFPHSNPNIRFDNGEPWPDYVFDADDIVEVEKPKEKTPDLDVGLISDKEGKILGFTIKTLAKGDRWDDCYRFCKVSGDWIVDKKYWVVKPCEMKEVYQRIFIDRLAEAFDGVLKFRATERITARFTAKAEKYLDEWLEILYPEEKEITSHE